MLRVVKKALLASLAILSLSSYLVAQKRATILGDVFQGEVVSSNETTREITITYTDKDKNKTETFVGVVAPGDQQQWRDGTKRELQMSEIKPGVRIRVFYKEKSDTVAGKKVKIFTIHRIDFLGRDEYTGLREALGVAPSLAVTLAPSDKLPAANPLKLYVAIHEPYLKERLIKWVSQWNKDHAAKYGSIETVSELDQSNVAVVFFWGWTDSVGLFPIISGWDVQYYQATLYLMTKDNEGVKVLWLQRAFESPRKTEAVRGQMEIEIEKRMRARGKK